MDQKHRLIHSIDWNDIEPRILPHVKALIEAGYETSGSCGHDMWITLTGLEPAKIPTLHADLKRMGYKDFQITYEIHDGFYHWSGATIQFGGDLAGDEKPFDLILLKVEPEAHPLYLVIRARRWPHTEHREDDTPEARYSHDQYFYDEHTCPTNWTDDILAVISKGDSDPHGFATFVRRVAPPEGMDASGDIDGDCNVDWSEIFQEAK